MDKAMFDYLVQPLNYQAAIELINNLEKVEKKLSDDFWELVTREIKEEFKSYPPIDASFTFISKYTHSYSGCEWFDIKKNDWKYYFISTEDEDIGIKIISDEHDSLSCKVNTIKSIVEDKQNGVAPYRKLEWPCYQTFDKWHFSDVNRKSQILPDERDNVIKDCSKILFDYIKKLITVCDKINTKLNEEQPNNLF